MRWKEVQKFLVQTGGDWSVKSDQYNPLIINEKLNGMNTNLTFKFDFQTDSTDCAYSLMNMIMEKLKTLQSACSSLKYIEVNLFTPEGTEDENKTALFKVVSDDLLNHVLAAEQPSKWHVFFTGMGESFQALNGSFKNTHYLILNYLLCYAGRLFFL